jgi:hypothetical protein
MGEDIVRVTDVSQLRNESHPLKKSGVTEISNLGTVRTYILTVVEGKPLEMVNADLRGVLVYSGLGSIYLNDKTLELKPDLMVTFPPGARIRIEAKKSIRGLAIGKL